MATIQMVDVTNFRNIKHQTLMLNKNTSIITGKNKLGKSNLLNAINWVLTDSLLTDKYGVGENDIESIVPTNHIKGEHTEVSITLDNGTTYTKIYKVGYTLDNSKINKHKTEYKINGVPKSTQREFYIELYKEFGFTPKFDTLKINEIRLMTNPLYALLIIDPKELRKLLVALGCTVDYEFLYSQGFEEFRGYAEQYHYKWDDLRTKAKADLKDLRDLQISHNSQLALFNDIDTNADNSLKLKELQARRDRLIAEATEIKVKSVDDSLKEIDLQIKEAEINNKEFINTRNQELQVQINDLENKLKNIQADAELDYAKRTKDIRDMISDTRNQMLTCNTELVGLLNSKNTLISKKNNLEREIEKAASEVETAGTELAEALMPTNEIVCPHCGKSFFKINDLTAQDHLKSVINTKQIEITNLKTEIESIDNQLETVNAQESIKQKLVNGLGAKVDDLVKQLNAVPKTEIYDTAIKNSILELKAKQQEAHIDTKLTELLTLRENMINNADQEKNSKIEAITQEVTTLNVDIANEIKFLNDVDRKKELLEAVKIDAKKVNEAEYKLNRITAFIQLMMKCINDKAKEITGFDFVLLEENLSNGNLTEVCYATVDGVPFKDINTADKIKYGIQFLERVRAIGNENTLPILADRLESISNIDDIRTSSKYQLICTRVNTNEEMRVE